MDQLARINVEQFYVSLPKT